MEVKSRDTSKKYSGKVFVFVGLAALVWTSLLLQFEPSNIGLKFAFDNTNRSLNTLLNVALVGIAFSLPLTANLYSPKLISMYLRHPVIVGGLVLLVITNILNTSMRFISHEQVFHGFLIQVNIYLTYMCLIGILPYLYTFAQFLKPEYFVPRLEFEAIKKYKSNNIAACFHGVDVIANLARTAQKRSDLNLFLISLNCITHILSHIIIHKIKNAKRTEHFFFSLGINMEGKSFLKTQNSWQEFYLLRTMLSISDSLDSSETEIQIEIVKRMQKTAALSVKHNNAPSIRMHIIMFNTLFRSAIEKKALGHFHNVCYGYRVFLESMADKDYDWIAEVITHMQHYSLRSHHPKEFPVLEVVFYDFGEYLINSLRDGSSTSITVFNEKISPFWKKVLAEKKVSEKQGLRSIIKVYWEAVASGFDNLAQCIKSRHLLDDSLHTDILSKMLKRNQPLNWEYNDRLIRFSYLDSETARCARLWLESRESKPLQSEERALKAS